MKVMAIDYGDARTGVAISDALGWMTGPTPGIHSWKPEQTAVRRANGKNIEFSQKKPIGSVQKNALSENSICKRYGSQTR